MIDLSKRYPGKPVVDPEGIAVMIATRRRVNFLKEAIASFVVMTEKPEKVSLWIARDDDDEETRDFATSTDFSDFPIAIRWVELPRQPTLCHIWTLLWQAIEGGPAYYFCIVDDYMMLTQGWDEALRVAMQAAPNSVALGCVHDLVNATPEAVTMFAASAGLLNVQGYFMPPYFPFWFGDTWLDQVTTAADLKIIVPIRVAPQVEGENGTFRMRDLGFWYRVFCALTEERLATARLLALAAYGDLPAWYEERADIVRRMNAELLRKVVEQPEIIQNMEALYASKKPWSDMDLDRYNAIKDAVVDYLGAEISS